MTSVMAYSHGTGIHKDDDTQKASVQCPSGPMMARGNPGGVEAWFRGKIFSFNSHIRLCIKT